MKAFITCTFLLISIFGFSQTTRDEVVERTPVGHKLIVNTYTGTGNSEKLIKRTTYHDVFGTGISIKPAKIEYFGGYKVDGISVWGVIKEEEYDMKGELTRSWKETENLIP